MTVECRRPRYWTCEEIHRGFASPVVQPADFPPSERARLVAGIVSAYESGRFTDEILVIARLIGQALQANLPTMAALRVQIGADGREMVRQIRRVAGVVPELWTLIRWLAL